MWPPTAATGKDKLCDVSPLMCHIALPVPFPIATLILKFSPPSCLFPYSYLCFSSASLTFSRVTSGTNLAAWFLERQNSRTQQRESVCVRVCVCTWRWERPFLATQIKLHVQTSNQEKAKKGKHANARHPGDMQTKDTGIEWHRRIMFVYKGATKVQEQALSQWEQ